MEQLRPVADGSHVHLVAVGGEIGTGRGAAEDTLAPDRRGLGGQQLGRLQAVPIGEQLEAYFLRWGCACGAPRKPPAEDRRARAGVRGCAGRASPVPMHRYWSRPAGGSQDTVGAQTQLMALSGGWQHVRGAVCGTAGILCLLL